MQSLVCAARAASVKLRKVRRDHAGTAIGVPTAIGVRISREANPGVPRGPPKGQTCLRVEIQVPASLSGIASPSNEADTRANIWAYTTIPSVRELLVVNSTRIEAELLRRDSNGVWPEQPELIGPGGSLTVVSADLTIPLTALYRTTALLPPAP